MTIYNVILFILFYFIIIVIFKTHNYFIKLNRTTSDALILLLESLENRRKATLGIMEIVKKHTGKKNQELFDNIVENTKIPLDNLSVTKQAEINDKLTEYIFRLIELSENNEKLLDDKKLNIANDIYIRNEIKLTDRKELYNKLATLLNKNIDKFPDNILSSATNIDKRELF